jgi:hypothetical protein
MKLYHVAVAVHLRSPGWSPEASNSQKVVFIHGLINNAVNTEKKKLLSLFININQLEALNFIISLFQASTCFEHMCSKHVEAW